MTKEEVLVELKELERVVASWEKEIKGTRSSLYADHLEIGKKVDERKLEICKLALKQLEGQEAKENYCLGCLDYGLKDDGTSGCTIPEDEEFVCRVRERHDYCCGNCEHWKNGLCTNHENIEVTCRYYAIGDEIVVSIKKESTDYCSGWVES